MAIFITIANAKLPAKPVSVFIIHRTAASYKQLSSSSSYSFINKLKVQLTQGGKNEPKGN